MVCAALSRKNKAIETMGHIEAELAFYPDGIYDGELYAHGKTFQENMKLIKKLRPESNQVKFHMYDMVEEDTFIKRYTKLVTVFSVEKDRTQHLKRVPTYRLNTESGIGIIHGDYLSQGYEGSMIRHGDAPYKINGRSDQLLKYKQFQDLKLKIIDIIPAEARPEWGTPVFELNGKQFKAGTKMSHDDRIDFLKNRDIYIGSFAEVRFFEYTDDGLPRFPIMEGEKLD
jgi:DNA ligase-1